MWVYTEKAEKASRYFNVPRKAGSQAMCGHKPVKGIIAKEWEKSGYIVWKDDNNENCQKQG